MTRRSDKTAAAAGPSAVSFVLRVTLVHTLTYVVVGALAANLLDYRGAFERPVVRDYMVAFGSAPVFWGPVAQLVRGLVIGLTLLPLRDFLKDTNRGWLYLWLLFVGIGIVSPPAAAPSSLEGLVYTRLPGWYHLFGLPEMLAQTLLFSLLVHRDLRRAAGAALPTASGRVVRALVGACFAFIGYAVVSTVFALLAGADVRAESNTSLKTLGLFAAPFVLNFALLSSSLGTSVHNSARNLPPAALFSLVFLANAAALLVYQALVLGGVNAVYVLAAPLLPAAVVAALLARQRGSAP